MPLLAKCLITFARVKLHGKVELAPRGATARVRRVLQRRGTCKAACAYSPRRRQSTHHCVLTPSATEVAMTLRTRLRRPERRVKCLPQGRHNVRDSASTCAWRSRLAKTCSVSTVAVEGRSIAHATLCERNRRQELPAVFGGVLLLLRPRRRRRLNVF